MVADTRAHTVINHLRCRAAGLFLGTAARRALILTLLVTTPFAARAADSEEKAVSAPIKGSVEHKPGNFMSEYGEKSRQHGLEEELLVATIAREVRCETSPVFPEDENGYCTLSYRGLEIEFLSVNRPRNKSSNDPYLLSIPLLTLKRMGNQEVRPLSTDCIRVTFNDVRSKVFSAFPLHVIIRSDGRVFGSEYGRECVG